MIHNPTITAFVPTVKQEQAKQFYMNTLGLILISEDDYALEFEGRGVLLRITSVEKLNPQPFTVLGFRITDIASQIKTLIEKGVEFESYSSLDQDDLGIWNSPSGAKIAWFKDPDGNLLSMTEYAS